MANPMELLKAAATTGNVGAQTPIEIFYGKIAKQIELAREVKEGKEHNSRSLWFRKQGTEWIVRIGRNGFEVAGSKLFKAKDLDGVVMVLAAAHDVIQSDAKLQATIAKHSDERSARLKAGRAKKAK